MTSRMSWITATILLISDIEPTDLNIKLPFTDVVGEKEKLDLDGANATGTTDIAQTSEIPVKQAGENNYQNKSVAHLSEHVRPQTTAPRLISLTWETTLANINDGNSKVGWQNTIDPNTNIGQLKISFADPVPLVGAAAQSASMICVQYSTLTTALTSTPAQP